MSSSLWTIAHARLHRTLKQRGLLPKGVRVLVAVSGGQDSVSLLRLLLDLQPKWDWYLGVGHCDHQWSLDAGIADHVRAIAQSWSLPFYSQEAVNLPETEAAARSWRYQALTTIATQGNFTHITTAHTQSDRAETFLYNLLRGAGSDGLQALTWERPLTSKIQLVRPFLEFTRAETGAICQEFQLPIWEDPFNHNLHYARNRLRAEVIPYLQEHFNPQVEKSLAQTAEILQAETTYLESEARKLWESCQVGDRPCLKRHLLSSAPLALQRRVIRHFLTNFLPTTPTFSHIEALIELLRAPNRSCTSTLPGGWTAVVQGEYILIEN